MPKVEVNPDDTVNRFTEIGKLKKLLEFKQEARLLVIEDKKGSGKTTLLRKIKDEVECESPCTHVHLGLEQLGTPLKLINFITNDLSERFNIQFTEYDAKYNMLINKQVPASADSAGKIIGTIGINNAKIRGEEHDIAAVRINEFTQNIHSERGEFTPEQEQIATVNCIKAFFNEFKTIADKQSVVILLDSCDEQCDKDLKDWIKNNFLKRLCFDEDRPKYLIIVLAGRPEGIPDFEKWGGGRYKQYITLIKPMEVFKEEDVEKCLKVHNCSDIPDDDKIYVCGKVQKGLSIHSAIIWASSLKNETQI